MTDLDRLIEELVKHNGDMVLVKSLKAKIEQELTPYDDTYIKSLESQVAKLKEELHLEKLLGEVGKQYKSTLDEIESSIDNHNWNMNTESAGLKLVNHIKEILAKHEDKK